jgi:hypothetical protein
MTQLQKYFRCSRLHILVLYQRGEQIRAHRMKCKPTEYTLNTNTVPHCHRIAATPTGSDMRTDSWRKTLYLHVVSMAMDMHTAYKHIDAKGQIPSSLSKSE